MKVFTKQINKIDVNYCLLDDVTNKPFNYKEFKNARKSIDRKVGNEQYKDPDAESKKLYEFEKNIWDNKILPNGKVLELGNIKKLHGEYQFINKTGNNIIRIASDYIGPSATGAFIRGIPSIIVGEYLLTGRTIGGHMFWTKHPSSINQNRASVNDRIDITLCELKDFYLKGIETKALFSTRLRKSFDFDKAWLENFKDFKGFVDFFFLKGSFVDDNYNIIMFAEVEKDNKFMPINYLSFMKNNIDAIKKRNKVIAQF